MAGTKKKRKPLQNPSRGFQTSSLPSKNKSAALEPSQNVSVVSDLQDDNGQRQSDPAKAPDPGLQRAQGFSELQQIELQQMSPEQLEEHLERSELEAALTAHGQKMKVDASKAANRLQTERRVLRPQASLLDTSEWLTSEIKSHVIDLAKAESFDQSIAHLKVVEKPLEHLTPEMDMCMKLWKLNHTLSRLGFLNLTAALQSALLSKPKDGETSLLLKETFWGMDAALAYIGLHSVDYNTLSYDRRRPLDAPKTESPEQIGLLEQSNPTRVAPDERSSEPEQSNLKLEETEDGDNLLSSTDEEIDPDDLQDRYVEVRTKLFEAEHGLQSSPMPEKAQEQRKQEHRLQHVLSKIQRDILFDEHEALGKWRPLEIELRKRLSQKRVPLKSKAKKAEEDESENAFSEKYTTTPDESSNSGDEDLILGSLFESGGNSGEESDVSKATKAENGCVLLQDFGTAAGNPRRILEDVCRATDSGCTISTRPVSEAVHSNRHSLRIRWSKDQIQFLSSTFRPARVSFLATARTIEACMQSIATPTLVQSEAYISVVVLFCLFAESVKGEKPYLRLPKVWREVWDTLSMLKQGEIHAQDMDALKRSLEIVRRSDVAPEAAVTVTTQRRKLNNESQTSQNSQRSMKFSAAEVVDSWRHKSTSFSYQHMLQSRQNLPIWKSRNEILQGVETHQVIVISGETGSGKSTQVPSFLLEHDMMAGEDSRILVTEPRRISAISLARRVSEELGERKSEVGSVKSLVGYAIRLESKISPSTRITFATTGVVMRMLENNDALQDIRYIVLDEIHERTMDTDFLLIVLRRLLPERPHLRLILMSATFDASLFAEYFSSLGMVTPILKVPGRTFPVQVHFLEDIIEMLRYKVGNRSVTGAAYDDDEIARHDDEEDPVKSLTGDLENYRPETQNFLANFDEYRIDYMLIVKAIGFVAANDNLQQYSRAFLIFLPGIAEIRRLQQTIESDSMFDKNWTIFVLHSSIPGEDQERAFAQPPPGTRKIVLSTNIAETGVTIPDITTVIDTGKENLYRFDEKKQLSKLTETFISKASSKQRQGRAARVQPGLALKLYTRYRYERFMPDQTAPEMLRLSLQEPALKIKLYNIGGIEETLAKALTPPAARNVRRAVEALREVRALTALEELTPLGRQLARLPLDIWLGKMILTGIAFQCLDCAVTIAALLISKSPFVISGRSAMPVNSPREIFNRGDSDLLMTYGAYSAWKRAITAGKALEFFQKHRFLSGQVLASIEDQKAQLLVSLVDAGILQLDNTEQSSLRRARLFTRNRHFFTIPNRYDINNGNDLAANATIASAFYPKLLIREGKAWRALATNQFVGLSPLSNLRNASVLPRFISFYQTSQSKSKSVIASELSPVDDFIIALFLGDADFKLYAGVIAIDGSRLRFAIKDLQTMVVLMVLRTRLQSIIAQRIQHPRRVLSARQETWMQVWQDIMEQWLALRSH